MESHVGLHSLTCPGNRGRYRRFLQFCVERDLLNANPLAGVKKPTQESPRDRVLSAAELGATWRLLTQD
jgi:site-specific recombinase XerC